MPKVNIHTPAGLDAFVDHLADGAPVILADMGAGSGQVTYDWFEKMYPDVAEAGIVFTTIGVVTADPASVESVLAWAARLQNRVAYLIVENSLTDHPDFTYWHESDQAKRFRSVFQPGRDPHGLPLARTRKRRPQPRGHPRGDCRHEPPMRRSCRELRSSCGPRATAGGCSPSSTK